MKCPHCGELLGEKVCPECQHSLPNESNFCYWCGKNLAAEGEIHEDQDLNGMDDDADPIDFASRKLCSDGACIGVIGSDGRCKECGKPYTGEAEDN